ncbi:MAG: LysR family transcriptional regulator, partial [Leptolyngbya sp. RL_3_1]|nr:LysR family transcriptional regulator [Leptolyngbya sp. RL_3_1]
EEEITSGVEVLKGTLRVSAPVDFGAEFVVPVIHDLLKSAPELSVELLLSSHFVNLVEQNIDVAIRIGDAAKSNLLSQKIGEVPRVLVASRSYLNCHGTPETPDDLIHHNFILYSPIQARSDIEFADGSKFPHAKIHSNITVNSVNGIRRLVQGGLGIHLGPAWVFKAALEQGDVCQILPRYALKSFPVHAVYVARAYLPRKTEAFIQQLSRHIEHNC